MWWFLSYINMNRPWVYMCPPSWTSFPPPSPTYPYGCPQSTGFGYRSSCMELALVIYFHMVRYMFQCCSFKSSYELTDWPSPSPTESKILFFLSVSPLLLHYCFSKIHIYALISVFAFLFLTYFTLYNRLQVHPPH